MIKCENIVLKNKIQEKTGQQTLDIDSTENLLQNMVLKSMFSSIKYSAEHTTVRFHLLKALTGESLHLTWCTTVVHHFPP